MTKLQKMMKDVDKDPAAGSEGEDHDEDEGAKDEDDDDVLGKEGDADNDGTPKTRKYRPRKGWSPIKSKWLVPIIKDQFAERPNMSYKECVHVLHQHARGEFLTKMILQSAIQLARFEIFGNPTENAHYTTAMLREMISRGHSVQVATKTALDVMTILEKIVVNKEAERLMATSGISMTQAGKKDYITEWLQLNKDMLRYGGLGIQMIGEEEPQFCGGIFFSMSYLSKVVPYLQDVFQADAAHMNFGKYTLFSCYGTTANGNTSPIAFAILFGNEDKAGWEEYWKFALHLHPSLNHFTKTFITDQAKGLVESIKKIIPEASHFHCSYH
jgi:hypothetical protein